MKRILLFAFATLFIMSCQKDQSDSSGTKSFDNKVATSWISLSMEMAKNTPGFSPPVSARSYGYLSLTMYEAARFGMPGYVSMAGQIDGLSASDLPVPLDQEYNWAIVTNAAASEILKACFVGASISNENLILENYLSVNNKLKTNVDKEVIDRSISFGKSMGSAIANFAGRDGQVQCYKTNFPASFSVPKGLGFWEPTSAQLIPLQPYWGSVRSFGIGNPDVTVLAPLDFSTDKNSEFYKEGIEVYNTLKNISDEQKLIANYWSDDPGKTATPPGHSMSIAKQILESENADLAKAVEVFAKVGMGVHDAFVSCWKTKYEYNLMRPVTYIKQNIDASFTTILPTPPFPEYTSGHSVQSGATAEILESLFGTSYAFVDHTHEQRSDINGSPRSFTSFKAFADEAAVSRLYGGIHYRRGIDQGVSQGREVGKNILKLKFK